MRETTHHPRLDAFLDGELDPVAAGAAKEHLDSCSTCQCAAAESRAVAEALVQPLPPLAPAFVARTRERALGRRLPSAPLWWLAVPAPWRVALAALVVLAALAGARIGRTLSDHAIAAQLVASLESPASAAMLGEPAAPLAAGRAR